MAKSNKSRFAILGMLHLHPQSSGYDLEKLMAESTQHFWKETYSSIYPILNECEKEGLVVLKEIPQGRRIRKVYSLTPKGEEILQGWLQEPIEPEKFRHELLLKLFFGPAVSPSLTHKHVEDYLRRLRVKKEILVQTRKRIIKEDKDAQGLPYWLMTLDYGLKQIDVTIEWCQDVIHQVEQLEKGTYRVEEK